MLAGLPQHVAALCLSQLAYSPLCVNLGACCWLTVSNFALVGKAWLIVDLFLLQRRCFLTKDHLAGQILKVGIHGQRQAKLVCEEVLCGNLQMQRNVSNVERRNQERRLLGNDHLADKSS